MADLKYNLLDPQGQLNTVRDRLRGLETEHFTVRVNTLLDTKNVNAESLTAQRTDLEEKIGVLRDEESRIEKLVEKQEKDKEAEAPATDAPPA